MYRHYIKRILDLFCAILLCIILLPVIVVVAIACAIAFDGNIFFVQTRIGKNERPFEIMKFTSMLPFNPDDPQPDSARITRFGNWLRRSSLDELPQLFNVIKGDMSMIGPRPLFEKYLPYYTEAEKIRHTVRPGISGLAQIKGRNLLQWDDRLAYDKQYVSQLSFFLDLSIAMMTLALLFTKKGMVADQRSVMRDLDEERKDAKH